MTRTKHKPRSKPSAPLTEPQYLGGIEPLETRRPVTLPKRPSLAEFRKLMPWSELSNAELEAEIDKAYRFAGIISAQIADTAASDIHWATYQDLKQEDLQ